MRFFKSKGNYLIITLFLFHVLFGSDLAFSMQNGNPCLKVTTDHKLLSIIPLADCPEKSFNGSIVMEDAILARADTENEAEMISFIDISQSGLTVLSIEGCGQKVCRVDLSSLNSGTYLIEVTTDMDRVFSDYVTVQ